MRCVLSWHIKPFLRNRLKMCEVPTDVKKRRMVEKRPIFDRTASQMGRLNKRVATSVTTILLYLELLHGAGIAPITAARQQGCVSTVFDFEEGRKSLEKWSKTGDAFNNQPTYGDARGLNAQHRVQPSYHQGKYWIGGDKDNSMGNLTSPTFKIKGASLGFLIGGGCINSNVRVELIVEGVPVRTATGRCAKTMIRHYWSVADFMGKSARLRLVDQSSNTWAHINFDDFREYNVCCAGYTGNVIVESNSPVKSKNHIIIRCTAVVSTGLAFSWFKDGKRIGWGSRWRIDSFNNFTSTLTVRDARTEDGGVYTCSVRNQVSNTTFVTVWPTLEILPATATRVEGENHTIACVVSDERFSTVLTERLSGGRTVQLNSTVMISNLTIPEGESVVEKNFLCCLTVDPKVHSSAATLIIVKKGRPTCNDETFLGVTWRKTVTGKIDIRPCPGTATGTVTRRCESVDSRAQWSRDVSFLDCVTETFLRLNEQIAALNDGFRLDQNITGILATLAGATKIGDPNLQQPIYSRDLELSVVILNTTLLYNKKIRAGLYKENRDKRKIPVGLYEKNREYFVIAASNLLDPFNKGIWRGLRKMGKKRDRELIRLIDEYGQQVASQLNDTQTEVLPMQTKNIVIQVSLIGLKSKVKTDGLSFKHNQTSISLPAEVFKTDQPITVVNVVYLTLNNIFQLGAGNLTLNKRWNNTKDANLNVNTTIVSSTVNPPPRYNLKTSVKIVLQNINVTKADAVGKCVFWKSGLPPYWTDYGCQGVPEESNNEITTCACNHLTIFAALMDGYPGGAKHQKYLELISVVGCSISLLAVLLTIAVTLFFWRELKSPPTIVLVNLCLAIAGSCVLIISEGLARRGSVSCTVIAALLHFFLLAVFSWMLCEGVLLYILLIQVFGESPPNEKIKYFLSFGWCFPAAVVGISLGVTRLEGYGTKGKECWLSVESGLIWAFVGPAVVIILINTLVFILVFCKMMRTSLIQKNKVKPKADKLRTGIKVTAVILPLLGITWIFGLLSFGPAAVTIKYLFTIFNSLQGLMIFVFHCVQNKQVRTAFKRRYQAGRRAARLISARSKRRPRQPVIELAAIKKDDQAKDNKYVVMDSESVSRDTHHLVQRR